MVIGNNSMECFTDEGMAEQAIYAILNVLNFILFVEGNQINKNLLSFATTKKFHSNIFVLRFV